MIVSPKDIRKSDMHLADVAPQAILWRPISYFARTIERDDDQLDSFQYVSYAIGNRIVFDLRHYNGHPENTTTLYLSFHIREINEIFDQLECIFLTLQMPKSSIAWKRGDAFQYGYLNRRTDDKLTEKEARILCLKIAAGSKNYEVSTTEIKHKILKYYVPSESDQVQSKTRRNEKLWQQIVGNVLVHSATNDGPFKLGYAELIKGGMRITSKGLNYLNSIGFLN